MAAPKGNQYWKRRSVHGRPLIFPNPDKLRNAAYKYLKWVEENPLLEDKAYCYQGVVVHDPIAKMRAPTILGMCVWLGLPYHTYQEYQKREDFSAVIHEIESVIRSKKFEGAAADLLNANIIARDLGLRDSVDNTHSVDSSLMSLLNDIAKGSSSDPGLKQDDDRVEQG